MKFVPLLGALIAPTLMIGVGTAHAEKRNEVTYLRGPYNIADFYRHRESFQYSAGFHFHHGKEHDVLQLTPLANHKKVDHDFNVEVTNFVYNRTAKTEPTMEYYGPYTARLAWTLYRTIDWTHIHHEQTYDIMAYKGISWDKKKEWTDRAVRYYLDKNPDVARSVAPLDVTMRRAAVMMKPYFTYYRNYYPESNGVAWVAHWWHPAIYEAMILGGNGAAQEQMVDQTNQVMLDEVFKVRPQRMLLSREVMPRYSRMSPESANIFDNLHMLHGFAYDIMAYEGWTPAQKKAELYRIIKAMSYQPGDEKLVRKFDAPYPNVDPRVYEDWMKGTQGSMSKIMMEMMDEMMPMMMPDISPADKEKVMAQFKMKMAPGMQPGEIPGSLHDALMAVYPQMKMMPGTMDAGKSSDMMTNMMLKGWQEKHGSMPDIAPLDMSSEPSTLPPLPAGVSIRPYGSPVTPQYGDLVQQDPTPLVQNISR